jgi:tetratricopeptide (TPR) repeat protein
LAADLRRFLEDKPIHARRPTVLHRVRKWARRHKALVTAAGLLLFLAAVALAVNNVLIRQEQKRTAAEKDRAETSYRLARQALEECVKKLGDDPRLKSGPLEDLRRVALEAELHFYEKFVELRGDEPEFQAERGRAYGRMGAINHQFGREAEAEAAQRRAMEVFAQLVAKYPAVPSYRQGLAYCHNDLALLLSDTGRSTEAEGHFKDAVALHTQLAAENPAEPPFRDGLAKHYINLGTLYAHTRRPNEAEQALREALAVLKVLASDQPRVPGYQANLGAGYNQLANLYKETGRLTQAEQAYQHALALQKLLVREHPAVPEYQAGLALSHGNLGVLYQQTRRPQPAEQAYHDAEALLKVLVQDHPAMTEYREHLGVYLNDRANLYKETGRLTEAEQTYLDALDLQRVLAREHPAIARYAVDLAGTQCNLGQLLRNSGRPEAALVWYTQAVATLEAVVAKDPHDVLARQFLAISRRGRAEPLNRLGRHAEALEDLERALALGNGREQTALRLERARTWARLKDHARATTEANVLAQADDASAEDLYDAACVYALAATAAHDDPKQAEQYAARAVQLLRQGVAKGYREMEDLKNDSDLASLRERDDFRKLLSELQEKNH